MKDIKENSNNTDTVGNTTRDSDDEFGRLFNSPETDTDGESRSSDLNPAKGGDGFTGNSDPIDEDSQDSAINLDEKIKDRLPVDFDIDDIGKIDLKEAEAIANEDILFLTEDDLIIGLEEYDLIPLKDSPVHDDIVETAKPVEATEKKQTFKAEKVTDEDRLKPDSELVEKIDKTRTVPIEETEITKDELVSESPAADQVHEEELEIVKENLQSSLLQMGSDNSNVIFIDDESIAKTLTGESVISEEEELRQIALNAVNIIEGKNRAFKQGSIEDDKKKIPSLLKYTKTGSQDFILDFEDEEYKYRDSELDFIESAIIEDDYGKYVRKIDDLYGSIDEKHTTHISELFGFSHEDFDVVHEKLYVEEYRDIDIDKEVDLFKTDSGSIDLSESKEKFCTYILPESDSLTNHEKISIEDDLSSTSAMIFEEDVSEIIKLYGKDVEDKPSLDLFEREEEEEEDLSDIDAKIAEETLEKTEDQVSGPVETVIEQIDDITDNIVIIDDEIDVDRFVKEFPENKQTNLKNLLKYLDGLFEKLPESTIKSFANSEYFDLYVKILNDMGVK